MKYRVQIIDRKTKKVETDMRDMTFRKAGKVQRGAEINLNHADYMVVIKPDPGEDELPEPCKSECPAGGVDHCTGCLD
jgi:hypothetical protein